MNAPISDAEWIVMDVFWAQAPLSADDVVAALTDRVDWKEPTIKTLLGRLVKKGALKFEAEGKKYWYRPAVTRAACVRSESRSLAQRLFGGSSGAMIAQFVSDARLTSAEIEAIRKLLDQKAK